MSINEIYEMIDLFYANIHLHEKLKKEQENEDNRSKSEYQVTGRAE